MQILTYQKTGLPLNITERFYIHKEASSENNLITNERSFQ